MKRWSFFVGSLIALSCSGFSGEVFGQTAPEPIPPVTLPMPELGPWDTISVPAERYKELEILPGQTFEWVWVTAPYPRHSLARRKEWNRLRNAVYVTYPYARKAGFIINDINFQLERLSSSNRRNEYVKTRERELKKEFTDPLTQLSIYQGKVLMKLINRQTGNNCYNLIRDYRGGFTARFWQTVAFFFSSNLKQPYDPKGEDRVMESIVQEVERMYGTGG